MAPNDHLQEVHFDKRSQTAKNSKINSILEAHIYKTYNNTLHAEEWRNVPEIPTKDEIMPTNLEIRSNTWNEYQRETPIDPNLPRNNIDSPWESKEAYLATHYQILRKDAVLSLQRSIESFQRNPSMMDDRDTCIYTNLTFKGLTCARSGIAFRVEFSLERSPKRIRWEQSKRLAEGCIVALSPQKDAFHKICKVGIVAARPIEGGLDQNPPQLDIFWGDIEDAVFDPMEKYLMIESRQGYFEASRHMLVAIQKLMTEKFHLANHIVSLDQDIKAPLYLEEHPQMDLSCLIDSNMEANELKGAREACLLENVNVLERFPLIPHCNMDRSQQKACEVMLTKRFAIVQGPPGTGKTHVSVTALKVLIASRAPNDPPIVVAAQTNHALDQLLNHVLAFEKDIVRLGGRCDKSNNEIVSRTLYELRTANNALKGVSKFGSAMAATKREHKSRTNDIKGTMLPITTGKTLTSQDLFDNDIISSSQKDSLFEEGWGDGEADNAVQDWLNEMVPIPQTPLVDPNLEMEECDDVEHEGILARGFEAPEGAESQGSRDEEGLSGDWIPFNRKYTGRTATVSLPRLKKLLAKKNLYDIPVPYRGEVYRSWEKQLNEKMLCELKNHMKEYTTMVKRQKLTKEFANVKLMQALNIKLVGCTTTGLSKYRSLLSALEPRILMIEEAAETLEGTVIAGMFDSLQQLILVGDHQQLQAHCSVVELGSEPYNLNISMFERLVTNGISFSMLNRQRRMNPEIRELLTIKSPGRPFYVDLKDHSSVVGRPPVDGMGVSTWFYSHNWPEHQNADGSWLNTDEAEMIAGFYNYLILNGHDQTKITILTFYNGQRKELLKQLRRVPNLLQYSHFKVHTVDSYQGEENDIILLSLVRSNNRMGVGFLNNKNRVVVALSRARRGFYLFGSSVTLRCGEKLVDEDDQHFARDLLWGSIISKMTEQGRFRLDAGLPIKCKVHGEVTHIYEPGEWVGNAGGCQKKCKATLSCSHDCPHNCHAFPHSVVICPAPCQKRVQGCGHYCSGTCGARCYCEKCKLEEPMIEALQTQIETLGRTRFHGAPWALKQIISSENGLLASLDVRNEDGKYQATIDDWQNFDPELSGRQIHDHLADPKKPIFDSSQIVFQETWKETKLNQDGWRVQISKKPESFHHNISESTIPATMQPPFHKPDKAWPKLKPNPPLPKADLKVKLQAPNANALELVERNPKSKAQSPQIPVRKLVSSYIGNDTQHQASMIFPPRLMDKISKPQIMESSAQLLANELVGLSLKE